MSCDKKECVCEGEVVVPQHGLPEGLHAAEAQASLLNYGLSLDEIKTAVQKYGAAIVGVLLEGLRVGFSKEWLFDLLDKIGKAGTQFLIDLVNQNRLFAAAQANGCHAAHAIDAVVGVPGEKLGGLLDGPFVQLIIDKYLPQLLDQLAPQILEKLAPKLIDLLLKMLQTWLQTNAASLQK